MAAIKGISKRKVAAAYQGGLSMKAIAAGFGCSVPNIQRLLLHSGIPRRPRGRLVDTAKAADW